MNAQFEHVQKLLRELQVEQAYELLKETICPPLSGSEQIVAKLG